MRERRKTCAPITSRSFQSIWVEFSILLALVDVVNLIFILSRPFGIQGSGSYLCDVVLKEPITLAYIQTFTDRFLSNLI